MLGPRDAPVDHIDVVALTDEELDQALPFGDVEDVNSIFCFSSERKFRIPALIASDLPEKPIDFFNLSISARISSFNEIDTIGMR